MFLLENVEKGKTFCEITKHLTCTNINCKYRYKNILNMLAKSNMLLKKEISIFVDHSTSYFCLIDKIKNLLKIYKQYNQAKDFDKTNNNNNFILFNSNLSTSVSISSSPSSTSN